tara:strand:+ start:5787 stop:6239 length:453 start_codon:yes stop_codon:yes gene_type:complete
MVNSADFSKRLEKILDYYGLSATAFSEKIDFNRSTISHLISGRNKPSLEFVMKVVNTFEEVNLYWLLNGKGTFPSTAEIEKKEAAVVPDVKTSEPVSATENKIQKKDVSGFPALEIDKESSSKLPSNSGSSSIDRIVIFYSDGTFKEYLP